MKLVILVVLQLLACLLAVESHVLDRHRRDEAADNLPKVNTTGRLAELRAKMKTEGVEAYLIPAADAHGSEYVSPWDQRRAYISGFSGSAGDAIVTLNKAALWTDGRYFLQASMELDDNWTLQKSGQPDVPTQTEWLNQVLNQNDVVGADPTVLSMTSWEKFEKELGKEKTITMKAITKNLVDEIWVGRPPASKEKLTVLAMEYAGKKWQDKVSDLQKQLSDQSATSIIVYSLDEVAWLLNLRGEDIKFNPFFIAYIIVTQNNVTLFVDIDKVTDAVKKHLGSEGCNSGKTCVMVKAYDQVMAEVAKLDDESDDKVWMDPRASYALKDSINADKLLLKHSPIGLSKAVKNEVERKGMKNAHIKDGVAFVEFLAWMEDEVSKGSKDLTEISAAAKLEEFKSKQADYRGASFASISGFGPNGAIIHYRPNNVTNRKITKESTYLIDTGTQFLDGTTDTTRTMHYGTPTAKQKEAYTRVLKGQIGLALTVFPNTTQGRYLDLAARRELWGNGLNYRHGTGHGIGMFLSVHEGPQRIAEGCPRDYERPVVPYMFQSDEPGYYEDGEFGIRLETIVMSVPADTKYTFNDVQYVTFESISLVPYEKNMINLDLMTPREIKWLNDYHKQTLDTIGAALKNQGKNDVYEWLEEKTKPVDTTTPTSGGGIVTAPAVLSALLLSVSIVVAVL